MEIKVLEIVGPIGAACLLIIFALSKWFLPALAESKKNWKNGSYCALGGDFTRHTNDVESNLDKLVAISDENRIYLKEMCEYGRRQEIAMTHLSAKLLNGYKKVD